MREPAFWHRRAGAAAALLAPFSAIYGAIAGHRMTRPGASVGVPVICVGNFTLGGAGKTPAALAIGQMLIDAGLHPAFLSRGYGGRLAGPVRVDPERHGAVDVGDEPLLLARVAPTIVARDRLRGAEAARADGADVVVMDDGFQNPALAKTLSILVVDAERGIGNGLVFPAGPLRAPLDVQLERADAMLIVGEQDAPASLLSTINDQRLPVFRARLAPDAKTVAALRSHRLLAFAGIGRPDKFFDSLTGAGLQVAHSQAFPDHHRYRRIEAVELVERANRESLVLVTTEKDRARMVRDSDLAALAAVVRVLPVSLEIENAAAFRGIVLDAARG